MDYKEFLEHYGVLGMHWGVRKDEGGVTTSRREAKRADKIVNRTPSEDHIRKQILQRKKTLALTNAELRLLNERLQLEQTYRNLSPKKITLGKSWNDSFMKKQATTTRNQFASQASAALIKKALLGVI